MSLTSTLLKTGALYALGRFASNVKGEDVEQLTGISAEDVKRYGIGRADAVLGTLGLQRASSVPNSTALVLSGFAAGAIVGAGVTFLFYSEQGKDVRKKVGEFFTKTDDDDSAADDSAKPSNGSTTVEA